MNIKNIIKSTLALWVIGISLQSCDDTKSYSDLLREEEHAVNWYLSNHTVSINVPADGKFETGENAPYYKMDKDGYVYMQIVNSGDEESKPEKGDIVYFRFKRMNIKEMYQGNAVSWEGNADNLTSTLGNTSFVYGNTVLSSTTIYGEGIQVPLKYVGYNSEVNLVIKSPEGFTTDASQCLPYVYNIKYFKAEY